MKYVITWKPRYGGSAAENEASIARLLKVLSQNAPASDVTVHQYVPRVDGQGGFMIAERDNLADLALGLFKLTPYDEIEVYPVIDAAEALPLVTEAVEFRNSVN
jgi:Protein of unknown function (DUF3303)